MRSCVLRATGWCLSSLRDGGGWRTVLGLLALVPGLILLAGDRGSVGAEEYSAYSDLKKPAIAVILSEKRNIDQFQEHFDLTAGQVDEVLAATRRENEVLAREFGESERVVAANKDLPKLEIKKKIAASDYDEKVAAAVGRTKTKIEAILPESQRSELQGWVDEQWNQEVRTASTQTYTASYYSHGIRCNVFATQYTGYTKHEVALPHRRLKFGSQPRVSVRRVSGGPKVWARAKEVGPWNTYDNYWARRKHRTMWKRVPRCKPEAQVAYYQNFNGGKDEFGREVLNPAGIDLTRSVSRNLGLKRNQNAWVYVRFPWVHW